MKNGNETPRIGTAGWSPDFEAPMTPQAEFLARVVLRPETSTTEDRLRRALEMLLRSAWQGATLGTIARTNACVVLGHPSKDETTPEGPCLCGKRTS